MESRSIDGVRCRHEYRRPDRDPGLRSDPVILLVGGNNMINYILLAITLICTAFNIYLTLIEGGYKRGYDKGLEDGIRFTNAAIEEDKADEIDCPWR